MPTSHEIAKAEFEKAAAGLPFATPDFSAEIVQVEPIDASFFTNSTQQRCIVRKDGKLFVSIY